MEAREKPRKSTLGRVLRAGISLAVIGVIFFYFLPKIVDYGDVVDAMSQMTWLELVTLAVLSVWNQATYALLEMSARPGLNPWQAMKITMTSTALANTLPVGAALGVGVQSAMYTSYGFPKTDIAISLMTTGIWNTFIKLLMPIVAVALLVIAGGSGEGMIAGAGIGVAIVIAVVGLFISALRNDSGARRAGRIVTALSTPVLKLFRRPPLEDLETWFVDFRRRTVHLVRRRWVWVTLTTIVSHGTLFLVLLLTMRHVGISPDDVSWQETLAAFAFVRLISVVPITPGGLGVVELGLTAALIAAGGAEAEVVAAVLIFRVLTFVLPIPLGLIAYLYWRKGAGARARVTELARQVGPT
jgi:putative heme transporter